MVLVQEQTGRPMDQIEDPDLNSHIYSELKKLNLQRINISMKKWAHELNRNFSRAEVQMMSKNMKKVLLCQRFWILGPYRMSRWQRFSSILWACI
jgi:hypothetical protein